MWLEPRESPVSLVFDFTFDATGFWSAHQDTLLRVASVFTTAHRDLPALPQDGWLAFTPWGTVDSPPVGQDEWRVYVGTHTNSSALGLGAMGGYSGSPPLAREWGGWFTVDPTVAPPLLFSVALHETMHTLGVMTHANDPSAVISPTVKSPPNEVLRPEDRQLLRESHWTLDTGDVMWLNPYGHEGWAIVPAKWVPAWDATASGRNPAHTVVPVTD